MSEAIVFAVLIGLGLSALYGALRLLFIRPAELAAIRQEARERQRRNAFVRAITKGAP